MRSATLIKAQNKYEKKNKLERQKRKLEKITCEVCKNKITRTSKARHEKSKKHQDNLSNFF